MKKLINLAKTDALMSIMPILGWYIVAFVYRDSDLSSIFTLTYWYQFIWLLIYGLIISASIKYLKKNNMKDMSMAYCAILESLLLIVVSSSIISFKIDFFLQYFGVSEKYKPFYILSLFMSSLEMITCGTALVKQYEEDYNGAFNLTIKYHIYKLATLTITGITIGRYNRELAALIEFFLLFLYILFIIKNNFKITKIHINCFKGFMIESPIIVPNVAMLIIYFFGLQRVVSHSTEFLIAYNIAALCTDTQWDILNSSIDTKTTLDICDNNYDKNKISIFGNNVLYSILLFLSSAIMIFLSSLFMNFDIKITYTILLIECSTFPLYAIKYTWQAWLKIKYSGAWMMILSFISYVVRIILSFTINGSYALSLGVLFNAIFGFITMMILYLYQRHKISLKEPKVYT